MHAGNDPSSGARSPLPVLCTPSCQHCGDRVAVTYPGGAEGDTLCVSGSGWLPGRRSQQDRCTKPEITGRVHRGLDVLSRGQVSTPRCCRDVWLPRSTCELILLSVRLSPAGENSSLGASQGLLCGPGWGRSTVGQEGDAGACRTGNELPDLCPHGQSMS